MALNVVQLVVHIAPIAAAAIPFRVCVISKHAESMMAALLAVEHVNLNEVL